MDGNDYVFQFDSPPRTKACSLSTPFFDEATSKIALDAMPELRLAYRDERRSTRLWMRSSDKTLIISCSSSSAFALSCCCFVDRRKGIKKDGKLVPLYTIDKLCINVNFKLIDITRVCCSRPISRVRGGKQNGRMHSRLPRAFGMHALFTCWSSMTVNKLGPGRSRAVFCSF